MTPLVVICVLGSLILLLSIRLVLQSRNRRQARTVTADQYTGAREALDSILRETQTITAIFSPEDAKFMAGTAPPEVQSLFLGERRRLALQWLRLTRRHVSRLMDLHLRLASNTNDPNLIFELTLTAKYVVFKIISTIAFILVWLLGPFRAAHVISFTVRQTGRLFTILDLRLEQLNPLRLRSGPESLIH